MCKGKDKRVCKNQLQRDTGMTLSENRPMQPKTVRPFDVSRSENAFGMTYATTSKAQCQMSEPSALRPFAATTIVAWRK